MKPMIFLPGLSLSALNRRSANGAKSAVLPAAYSSATTLTFGRMPASACLKAATPSRPKAVSRPSMPTETSPLVGNGGGAGERVLVGAAAGAEDVAVPLVAGDAVGHRRLDDQHLLAAPRPPAAWRARRASRWCRRRCRPCRRRSTPPAATCRDRA